MLQDRQSFKLGPASMDTNVAINFQLSPEFPEILPHQSLHLANKIWIWFSEDIKRALNMGAGTKEVATIEALPDKVKSLTRAAGTLSFHITHIFPLKNMFCIFHRSCWGCSPSWSTRRWWSTLWCQRSGEWLPRFRLLNLFQKSISIWICVWIWTSLERVFASISIGQDSRLWGFVSLRPEISGLHIQSQGARKLQIWF